MRLGGSCGRLLRPFHAASQAQEDAHAGAALLSRRQMMRRVHKYDTPFVPTPITPRLLPRQTLEQEEALALSQNRYPLSSVQAQSLRVMYLAHIKALDEEIAKLKGEQDVLDR